MMRFSGKANVVLSLVGLIFVAASQASADVLINEDFESYAIGSIPTNPGDGNPNNWIVSETTSGLAQVTAGSSPDGEGANARVFAINVPTDTDDVLLVRRFVSQAIGTGNSNVQTSFKIRVDDIVLATDWRFLVSNANGADIAAYVRINPSLASGAFSIIGSTDGPGSGATQRESSGVLIQQGDWYQLTVNMDVSTSQFSLKVENLDDSSPSQTGQTALAYFYQDPAELGRITMNDVTSAGRPINAVINDIHVDTVVPEPASIGLLGLGLLIVASRRG